MNNPEEDKMGKEYLHQLPDILFADEFQNMEISEEKTVGKDEILRLMPGVTRSGIISILFENCMQQLFRSGWNPEEESGFKEGMVTLARLCYGSGIQEEDALKWTYIHLMRKDKMEEISSTFRTVYMMKKDVFGGNPAFTKEQRMTYQTEDFLRRRYDIRFNTMKMQNEFMERRSARHDYKPLEARHINGMCIRALKEGLQLWDKDVRRYLESDYMPVYSPLEKYLEGLPKWDGKDRIRGIARLVPTDHAEWESLFYKWFLSMVAHWMREDGKHANSLSPLLIGPQGCGKSTWCANLLPPELQDYYTDSLDLSSKRKAELNLTRFGLINFDEFDSITESQQAYLKHILQKAVVKTAVPYKSNIQSMRRYASFIGTSNSMDLLNDPTGSRRFLCVEVTGKILYSKKLNYPQIYAQAVEAIRKGEVYWLTGDEETLLTEKNEAFSRQSLEEQLFLDYFDIPGEEEDGEWKTSAEILQIMEKRSHKKFANGHYIYFARILRKLGIASKRTKKANYYHVRMKV